MIKEARAREREHGTDRKWKRGKRRKIWKSQAEILNWNEKQKEKCIAVNSREESRFSGERSDTGKRLLRTGYGGVQSWSD